MLWWAASLAFLVWGGMAATFALVELPRSLHLYERCESDVANFHQFVSFVSNLVFLFSMLFYLWRYRATQCHVFLGSAVVVANAGLNSSFYHGSDNYWMSGPMDIAGVLWVMAHFVYALMVDEYRLTRRVALDMLVVGVAAYYFCWHTPYRPQEILMRIGVGWILIYALGHSVRVYHSTHTPLVFTLFAAALGLVHQLFFYHGCAIGRYTHGAVHLLLALTALCVTEALFALQAHQRSAKISSHSMTPLEGGAMV